MKINIIKIINFINGVPDNSYVNVFFTLKDDHLEHLFEVTISEVLASHIELLNN